MMLCPLHDRDGNPRTLSTIEFNDFAQLVVVEEGYTVEYKSAWDEDVKRKLPKIVTSFANANGGWLFVGIKNDGTYSGISRVRSDFDQTIAQIVRRHVTPLPRFETRFIEEPNSELGVLVVEIVEGVAPPYIADGCVYIRVGSSSEKFVSKADSYVLIDLYRKARSNRDQIERFCHRTVYLPPTRIGEGKNEGGIPIINVYLKHLYPNRRISRSFADSDDEERIMLRYISEYYKDYVCHRAHDSLIFRSSLGNHVDNVGPVIELFFDGSIKLSIPLVLFQSEQREEAIVRLQSLRSIQNVDLVDVIDGSSSRNSVMMFSYFVDEYIAEKERDLSDYALCFEYENMQGVFVEFKTEAYSEYVKNNGFPFIATVDERSEPFIPERVRDGGGMQLTRAVWIRFLDGLGLPASSADPEKRKALDDVLGFSEPNKEELNGRNSSR